MSNQYIFKKPDNLDNPYIYKNDINQSNYYNRRNPFIDGNQPFISDLAERTAREEAKMINYIQQLIQPRLDKGEKYFTESCKNFDVFMYRQVIAEHFRPQGIDIRIRSNRSDLLVFATNRSTN